MSVRITESLIHLQLKIKQLRWRAATALIQSSSVLYPRNTLWNWRKWRLFVLYFAGTKLLVGVGRATEVLTSARG
jgi:hypothetical protein